MMNMTQIGRLSANSDWHNAGLRVQASDDKPNRQGQQSKGAAPKDKRFLTDDDKDYQIDEYV